MKLNNYFPDRSTTTSGYIRAYINALENCLVRIKYYEQTNDIRFLNESNDWLDVAQIYMKEMNSAETCET